MTHNLDLQFALRGLLLPIIQEAIADELKRVPSLPAQPQPEQPLKAEELAKVLDVSTATITVWENQGLIPARWISNRKFYLLSEVTAAMKLDPRFERKNTLRKKSLSTIS